MVKKQLEKRYNHQEVEARIYKLWEKSGYFNPDKLPPRHKKPFTIIMPPPNANDPLHIGHALGMTIEDIIIRYNRMQGKKTLWLPGMDHAGFETQVVYEKKLEKQGRSRFKMTRDDFYKEVWDYTQKNRDIVRQQIKRLGASCDWSRETFTLDEKIINTVYETFKKMYDENLIYRGKKLVNYCIKHQTAFSELEIQHEQRKDPLYYIKYGPLVVATVRPETIFGDTALAVNPNDKRYKKYIGKEIEVDMLIEKRKIKVISDKYVDPKFGTGALKITPAHDQNDYEMWLRHKDDISGPIQAINKEGRLTKITGKYAGMKILEARKKIVQDMREKGLIKKIDVNYTHNVALCYKCKNTIEPVLMKQWFIDIKPLATPAIKAITTNKIKITPSNQRKVYLHWMRNIKDWNISRQNWWGIDIPAWKCTECSSNKNNNANNDDDENETWIITKGEEPKECTKCGGKKLERDTDVFDTWFSSGQWPFATLNYPDGKDFKKYYPTSTMETGYDIIFFWVARMIMLGIYRTGKIPFKLVYLHGLVRDKDKQKMSKSKGNVIDPLGIIEEYGTDALRMALTIGTSIGKDPTISEDKIRGYRNFTTKLWNVTRFLIMNLENYTPKKQLPNLTPKDKKILKEFEEVVKKVTHNMKANRYWQAAEDIYHYSWHTFADKIIEDSKKILQGDDSKTKKSRQYVLIKIWSDTLKLLHPFMPFITEELYSYLPIKDKKMLIIEKWPEAH